MNDSIKSRMRAVDDALQNNLISSSQALDLLHQVHIDAHMDEKAHLLTGFKDAWENNLSKSQVFGSQLGENPLQDAIDDLEHGDLLVLDDHMRATYLRPYEGSDEGVWVQLEGYQHATFVLPTSRIVQIHKAYKNLKSEKPKCDCGSVHVRLPCRDYCSTMEGVV